MFKKGDNVVCIKKDIYGFTKYKTYKISGCNYDTIFLMNDANIITYHLYPNRIFVSLQEYRKLKLQVLDSNSL